MSVCGEGGRKAQETRCLRRKNPAADVNTCRFLASQTPVASAAAVAVTAVAATHAAVAGCCLCRLHTHIQIAKTLRSRSTSTGPAGSEEFYEQPGNEEHSALTADCAVHRGAASVRSCCSFAVLREASAAAVLIQQQAATAAAAELPRTLHQPMPPTNYGPFEISVETNIGGRKHQEDRFTVCPALLAGRNDVAFFGVFDGTVGDFASDSVKDLVVPHLVSSGGWQRAAAFLSESCGEAAAAAAAGLPEALAAAVRSMYTGADAELIELCRQRANDYASSTSVTAILAGGFLAIGHLGDSRIAIGVEREEGNVEGEFATVDHKPNMPLEQERIIGKDLKGYGLSCEPDVRVVRLSDRHKLMILATDGLWDVFSATQAVQIAWAAHQQGKPASRENPSDSLVQHALADQQERGHCADNITAMVVFFTP
ncbi:probable protein phosphatase 2C 34 [Cyclospora cayetanensis]|uniref:Probable protein phosphatase 2C 34 n=1 Tax=Cyclospora cayetanensis TaxID=88456 RepID=A0A6P6RXY3_9EIME|nr:probable protein phosphatase 2C 34 [Cyclospora cayetanensis]